MRGQDTAPNLRIVESDELAACLVVARPHRPGQVLVVTSAKLTGPQLLVLADLVLNDDERRQLAEWLAAERGLGSV
jgi:hypothetical protein